LGNRTPGQIPLQRLPSDQHRLQTRWRREPMLEKAMQHRGHQRKMANRMTIQRAAEFDRIETRLH
jgi:hypothetical protein